jgi:hypothetical protein
VRPLGAAALACLTLAQPGCRHDDPAERLPAGLPAPVSETRDAILAAAESGAYDPLREVLDPKVFLSDFGFGDVPDPVGLWERLGPKPLETMGGLLRMRHVVRRTNEGTLYEWPRFDANSKREEATEREREQLSSFMTDEELENAFLPELGYTGPRLGILADGVWWFFVLEGEGR